LSDSEQPKASGGVRGTRIVFILIGLICLVYGLPYMLGGLQSGDYTSFILGFFLFMLFFSFIGAARSSPSQNPIFRTVTVAKCSKCEYTEVRDFQKGDYVYKALGKCKDCEGTLYVRSIYSIPVHRTELSPS
jgi:hypothetical protein